MTTQHTPPGGALSDTIAPNAALQSAPGEDPVRAECWYRASPERVFRAWTTPEELREWFGLRPRSLSRVEVDLRVGGTYRFIFAEGTEQRHELTGTYRVIEPAARLDFSWQHVQGPASGPVEATAVSEVSVAFEAAGGGTLLRVVHRGIRTEDTRKGVGNGWVASLGSLQAQLAA